MEALIVKNLTFFYKADKDEETKIIFKDFNLHLELGKVYALTGESGVGKSTLAHLMAGHLRPVEGEILLGDTKIEEPCREIFIVHQENDLFPWLSVYDQLKFTGASENEIHEMLKIVKLGDSLYLYPNELSGGMKKRLALIRALLLKPKVLILDETMGSLDKGMIRDILSEIYPQWKKHNLTVIFITHHLDEIKDFIEQRISI